MPTDTDTISTPISSELAQRIAQREAAELAILDTLRRHWPPGVRVSVSRRHLGRESALSCIVVDHHASGGAVDVELENVKSGARRRYDVRTSRITLAD